MNLQVIKSLKGREEYVLLPVAVYRALKEEIDEELLGLEAWAEKDEDYVDFDPADYVRNPVALARMRAGVKQSILAKQMGVSQPYLSKLERAEKVAPKALEKVRAALKEIKTRRAA